MVPHSKKIFSQPEAPDDSVNHLGGIKDTEHHRDVSLIACEAMAEAVNQMSVNIDAFPPANTAAFRAQESGHPKHRTPVLRGLGEENLPKKPVFPPAAAKCRQQTRRSSRFFESGVSEFITEVADPDIVTLGCIPASWGVREELIEASRQLWRL